MIKIYLNSLKFTPALFRDCSIQLKISSSDFQEALSSRLQYLKDKNQVVFNECLDIYHTKQIQFIQIEIIQFDDLIKKDTTIAVTTLDIFNLEKQRDIVWPSNDKKVQCQLNAKIEFYFSAADRELFNSKMSQKQNFQEQVEDMSQDEKEINLEVMKLAGVQTQFVKNITPIVSIFKIISNVMSWKIRRLTWRCSIALTLLVVFNWSILYLIGAIYLYYKGFKVADRLMSAYRIIDKLDNKQKLENYKTNLAFLQDNMKFYNAHYKHIHDIMASEDRTQFLQIFTTLRKYGLIITLAVFIFGLKLGFLAWFWVALLSQHPRTSSISQSACRKFVSISNSLDRLFINFFKQYQQIKNKKLENIELSEKNESKDGEVKISRKTYFVYENQRWWIGKNWCEQTLPGERGGWSDEQGLVEISKEYFKLPGNNWQWEDEWKLLINEQTDQEGWQYAIDFTK